MRYYYAETVRDGRQDEFYTDLLRFNSKRERDSFVLRDHDSTEISSKKARELYKDHFKNWK